MAHSAQHDHFQGKTAEEHVHQARKQHQVTEDDHGMETSGFLHVAIESARDTAIALLLASVILLHFTSFSSPMAWALVAVALGFIVWKAGRAALCAWSKLERMHRVVEQEEYEIDNNRGQEREELRVLYTAKGFEGQMLEDVIDVLMADKQRLLRVMLEEEMGLNLERDEHPLKLAYGASLGSLAASIVTLPLFFALPQWGVLFGALLTLAGTAVIHAAITRNRILHALVWNVALGIVSYSFVKLLSDFFFTLSR